MKRYTVVLVNGYSSIRRTFDAKDRNDLDAQIAEAHPEHKLETIVSEIDI